MLEWIIAITCMIPAAVSDVRYRTVSLESCVAALLAGCVLFGMWCMTAAIHDIWMAGLIGGSAVAATIYTRRMMGSGDWWFAVGIILILCTIHPLALLYTLGITMCALLFCHCMICVRRPGLPFPQRLYLYKKQAGDRFSVDSTGVMLEPSISDVIVRPGLPMVTFLVVCSVMCGVWFSL